MIPPGDLSALIVATSLMIPPLFSKFLLRRLAVGLLEFRGVVFPKDRLMLAGVGEGLGLEIVLRVGN